ncbi:MAG TPA: hypothetical protein VF060_22415 [Trebonia sp.]
MNPVLASELADCRVRDLRHAAARRELARRANRAAVARSWRAGHHHGPAPLRRQVGFALIEAGLRLVTSTAEPAGLHTSS